MQRDQRAYLWDICNSADLVLEFIANRTLPEYQQDAMLRSAVERQLEIIGDSVVWSVIQTDLPILKNEVEAVLASLDV
jgi:uncharacterized protein with HEPN domain